MPILLVCDSEKAGDDTSGSADDPCADLDTKAACESHELPDEVAGAGGCYWVEVLTEEGQDACSGAAEERCVAFTGTEIGCLSSCAGDAPVYWRNAEGGVEVVVSPVCGPDPHGAEWNDCHEVAQEACDCACTP